jgi:hypothetical protein
MRTTSKSAYDGLGDLAAAAGRSHGGASLGDGGLVAEPLR